MFIGNLNQAIDTISESKFIEDKIILELNDEANFFLYDSIWDSQKNFRAVYGATGHIKGLVSSGMKGISIKKNSSNSNGDDINPEFVAKLKNITNCYVNCLAMNWVEVEKKAKSIFIDELLNVNHKDSDTTFTFVNKCKEAEKISTPHCNLGSIVNLYKLSSKIKISGTNNGVYIKGEKCDLLQFSNALRWEALNANDLSSIRAIMCSYNSHNGLFSEIPKDLILKIVDLISFIIAPNPIEWKQASLQI